MGLPRSLRKLYEACPWAWDIPRSTLEVKPSDKRNGDLEQKGTA